MATNNGPVMQGIKNSWSLLAFARMKGKMQVGEFESGHYSLCKQGANSWEDVDLGI